MTKCGAQGASDDVQVELIAVLVAVIEGVPSVLTLDGGQRLPSGPFQHEHRSLQAGLREWVEQQTGHTLGYIEQLYTFADRGRMGGEGGEHAISISYLGLTDGDTAQKPDGAPWVGWYSCFPWEDYRAGPPAIVEEALKPALRAWAVKDEGRWQRAASVFGFDGFGWNEELALQRYELLYEAALVAEAGATDRGLGCAMFADHRRILATAIARLRTKIKYRPVVFELMSPTFTLLQLQKTVEALAGQQAHKQNFRRLIEQQELVEETGEMSSATGGRPAKLFRFRPAIHRERTLMGTRLPLTRS